jgi:mannose-6-phosphate isomerase-like protein (cupin superfamily)
MVKKVNQKRIYELDLKEWLPIREDVTTLVFGKLIIPKDWSNVKISVTKVSTQGEFSSHVDSYHHVFYFLKGKGIGYIDNEEYEIKPELVVEIPAGTKHGYKNTGTEDLFLITVNIPEVEIKK